MLHPVSWVVWTLSVAAVATLTHNPLYLSILLGVVALQYVVAARQRPDAQGWRQLVRFALGLALLVIPFNALNAHAGKHVIVQLPHQWPLIGGNITWEAVLWGASTALGLLVLILLFAAFSLQVDRGQLLRLTPPFLFEAGLIASIALAFVPQMMAALREIREAQLIRGHRIKGLRDMLPLVMALLTNGLERSLQLAESMESRGFGRARTLSPRYDMALKSLSLVGVAGLLGSAFAWTYYAAWAGWLGGGISTLLLVAAFWAQSRRVQRTHYVREQWRAADGIAIGAALAVLCVFVAVRVYDGAALQYYAYTSLLPSFQPWLGALLLLLVVPVAQEGMR